MKTTAGKTKAVPTGERVIKIYSVNGRRIIAQISARNFKDALTRYFKKNWQDRGWEHEIKGNTMQVYKGDAVRHYRALEISQKP